MIKLKPLIVVDMWLEATWVTTRLPDAEVPGEVIETQVWCQSYHPTQIQMLRDRAAEYGTPLDEYEQMLADWIAGYVPPEPEPEPTQFEKDQARYQKRAAVRDSLIAYMAADNMSRVRSGVWNVADLTNLLSDPSVSAANQYMSTLSYELAAVAIQNATTPILTPEIKSDLVARLTEHFYL